MGGVSGGGVFSLWVSFGEIERPSPIFRMGTNMKCRKFAYGEFNWVELDRLIRCRRPGSNA